MNDDPPSQESPVASTPLELTRRKAVVGAQTAMASLVLAKHAASPYVRPYITAVRIAVGKLAFSRSARVGAVVVAILAVVSLFADAIANDVPIVCHWRGVVYVLPAVTRPSALEGLTCTAMAKSEQPGDWIVAPLVTQSPTRAGPPEDVLLPPRTRGHWLGTDALGRDMFARFVHGARFAFTLGIGGSLILVAIGVTLGALAGFSGGIIDGLVARLVEALLSIPTLLLVLVVEALISRPTTATLLWTIALTRWPELARLVRAEVLRVLGREYVAAARALGASPFRILSRHVLPNAIGPAIVAAAFGVASITVIQATVDFLRVGSPDTLASWGEALSEARSHPGAWWLIAFPGGALLATVVALNLIGEAARDALDPWSPRVVPSKWPDKALPRDAQ